MIYDQKHTWTSYLKILRSKCLQKLSTLKALKNSNTEVKRKIHLRVYRILIRYQLDYSCSLSNFLNKSALATVDTIHNAKIRLSLPKYTCIQ